MDLIHLVVHIADLFIRKRCHNAACLFHVGIVGVPDTVLLHKAHRIADQGVLYGIRERALLIHILHGKSRKACQKAVRQDVVRRALYVALLVPGDLALVGIEIPDHLAVLTDGNELGNITKGETVDRIVQLTDLRGRKSRHNRVEGLAVRIHPLTVRILLIAHQLMDLHVVHAIVDLTARQPIQ